MSSQLLIYRLTKSINLKPWNIRHFSTSKIIFTKKSKPPIDPSINLDPKDSIENPSDSLKTPSSDAADLTGPDDLFKKNAAEAKARLAAKKIQRSSKNLDAAFQNTLSSTTTDKNIDGPTASMGKAVIAPDPDSNPYLAPLETNIRLKKSKSFTNPPGKLPVLHDYKGELAEKKGGAGYVEVSHLEGLNYPFLADKSPYSGLKKKRFDKKLLAQHKTLSDPLWHLSGGRYAIDEPTADMSRDFNDDKRVWLGLFIGCWLFFWGIKVYWQQFWRPDEEGVGNTGIGEGYFHFNLENELHNLRQKTGPISHGDGYGPNILRSTTYREILKSECLKKFGLEQGKQVYEETIYDVTGSYKLAHTPKVISSPWFWQQPNEDGESPPLLVK